MPYRFFGANITAYGTAIYAGDDDHIGRGVRIVSTAGSAIGGGGPAVSRIGLDISGSVEGWLYGIDLGSADDTTITIQSTGTIHGGSRGAILLRDTHAVVSNFGTISAGNSGTSGYVIASYGSLELYNAGSIISTSPYMPSIDLRPIFGSDSQNNDIVNTGIISSQSLAVIGTQSVDRIYNSGTIIGGLVLGANDDVYVGTNGRIVGIVDGGTGNDALIGGTYADELLDRVGANWIVGGGGGDSITLEVDAFTDTVFAGEVSGSDNSLSDALFILDEGGVNVFLGGGYISTVVAGNPVVAWIGTGFENVTTSFGNDALIGNAAANILDGWGGSDWLVGNGGADTFRFFAARHIGAGEQIADFRRSDGDKIDLSRIDSNEPTAGDDAFVFRTARTNGAAGEIVVTNYANGARVDLYTDSDTTIDATLYVTFAQAGMGGLQASDFIL